MPVKNRLFSPKTARFVGSETRKPSPIEIALQYAEVLKDPSVTSKAEVARRFGVSRARVCQMLKLLELDERILEFLENVALSNSPARPSKKSGNFMKNNLKERRTDLIIRRCRENR